MPVFEDNASRWEQNPDGSYSRLPKQKQPPTSLGAVKEAIAANTQDIADNTGAIDGLKQAVPVMFAANGSQSIPSNTSTNNVTNLIGANVEINTANWGYADPDNFKVGTSGLYLVSIAFGFGSGGGTVRAFSAGSPDISTGVGNVGLATGNPSDGNTSGFGYGNGSSRVVRLEKDWTVFLRARQNSGSNNTLTWHFSAILLEADEQVQPTQIATRAEATPTTPVEYDLAALSRTSEIGPFTGTEVIPMENAYGKTQYADADAGTITIWEDGVYKVDAHYTNVGTGGVPADSRSVLSVPGVCRDVQATPSSQTSEVNLNATNTMYLTAGTVLNITAHFSNATSVTRGSLVVQRLDTARVVATTPHACVLQGSGTQSITHAQPRNRVTFWQAEHDPSGMYQGGDQVNILADGLYQVEAMISFSGNDTGFRAIGLTLNGSTEGWEANLVPGGTGRMNFGVSKVFSLSKGDTVGVWAYQTSGGNLDIYGASNPHYSWFSVVRVGGSTKNGVVAINGSDPGWLDDFQPVSDGARYRYNEQMVEISFRVNKTANHPSGSQGMSVFQLPASLAPKGGRAAVHAYSVNGGSTEGPEFQGYVQGTDDSSPGLIALTTRNGDVAMNSGTWIRIGGMWLRDDTTPLP